MTPCAPQLEHEPVQPFFTEQGRLKFLDGTELVAFERVWENCGFPKGTDPEAFRIILRYAWQQVAGQEGAFLVRLENVPALLKHLSELFEAAIARIDDIVDQRGIRETIVLDGMEVETGITLPRELMDDPYCPPGVQYD